MNINIPHAHETLQVSQSSFINTNILMDIVARINEAAKTGHTSVQFEITDIPGTKDIWASVKACKKALKEKGYGVSLQKLRAPPRDGGFIYGAGITITWHPPERNS